MLINLLLRRQGGGGWQVQGLSRLQSEFKSSLGNLVRLPQNEKSKEDEEWNSRAESLPSMFEALGPIPSVEINKRNTRKH